MRRLSREASIGAKRNFAAFFFCSLNQSFGPAVQENTQKLKNKQQITKLRFADYGATSIGISEALFCPQKRDLNFCLLPKAK